MDQMMYQILAQVHYMPDAWLAHANAFTVRDEFVKLLQYKFVYLLEELASPIITPFMLLFWLRPRAGRLVDFLRHFTVEVVGVGDVCSFAQMDTRRHGNPRWLSRTSARKSHQARNGKTELSLIHFVHTNPQWRVPGEAHAFLETIKDQAVRETATSASMSGAGIEGAGDLVASAITQANTQANTQPSLLNKSLYHLQSLVYNSNLVKSNGATAAAAAAAGTSQFELSSQLPRGAVSRVEGPLFVSKHKTLLTIAQASTLQLSQTLLPAVSAPVVTTALENNLDMCFSALYMHELHRKYHHGDYLDLDKVKEEVVDDEEQEETREHYYNRIQDDENDEEEIVNNSRKPLLAAGRTKGSTLKQNENENTEDEVEDGTALMSANTYTSGNHLKISYTKGDNTVIKM